MTTPLEEAKIIDQVLTGAAVEGARFRPGTIQSEGQHLNDASLVRQRLEAFEATTGWIQTTSSVVPVDEFDQAVGHILCAEVADEETSLHIRQDGRGGWIVTTLSGDDGDDLVTETEYWAKKPFRKLRYEVAWRREQTEDNLHQWRPYAARLIPNNRGNE